MAWLAVAAAIAAAEYLYMKRRRRKLRTHALVFVTLAFAAAYTQYALSLETREAARPAEIWTTVFRPIQSLITGKEPRP